MEYVGTRWFRCDFHLHTKCSECYTENNTYEEWIDEVCRKGLNCIAVTDHNDYRAIDEIKELGKQRGITVFPGVEVTCDTSKIHMLIIFDVDKTQENVRDFLNLLGIDSELIGQSIGTSLSVFDVCTKAKEKKALVIAAHIDEPSSISKIAPQQLQKLLSNEYLDAVQVVNKDIWEGYLTTKDSEAMYTKLSEKYGTLASQENIESWRKTYEKAIKANIPIIAASDNPKGAGSSHHGLWGIGSRYTWIKMDCNPSLESIRQAFLSADIRVSLDSDSIESPEKLPALWIKSLSITDTTINPLSKKIELNFSPQLNCVIGGRGSGKSSIVRTLVGGLQLDQRASIAVQAEQDNYYKRNKTDTKTGESQGILKEKSQIEIIFVRNGSLFKIQVSDIKSAKDQKRTIYEFDSDKGEWLEVEDDFLSFMNAQVYTQKEIFEIAKDSEALLKIIDQEIEEIPILKENCHQSFESIIEKKKEILKYEAVCSKESLVKTEIKDLNKQIQFFKESGFAQQIESKQKIASEEAEINRLKNLLSEYEEALQTAVESLPSLDLKLDNCSQELMSVYSGVSMRVNSAISEMNHAILEIHDTNESIDSQLLTTGWIKNRERTQSSYDKAQTELKVRNIEVTKLDDLLSAKTAKETQLQEIQSARQSLKEALVTLKELRRNYKQQIESIRTKRESFVNSVLKEDDNVRIEFIPSANRESFEKATKDLLGKDGVRITEDILKLEEIAFSSNGMERFREIIKQLRNEENCKESLSSYFRNGILDMENERFFRLEEFIPDDELIVSYKPEGGRKYMPLSKASAGQKTTAILTFVLSYGDIPLILDQPEDDLDNKLVYELVVKRLKNSKKHRQIIVITHNANIPVNGDAEYITSMDSDSVSVKKKCEGTLDQAEIRSEICDVMEGSEPAFSMRAKKYHLRITKE